MKDTQNIVLNGLICAFAGIILSGLAVLGAQTAASGRSRSDPTPSTPETEIGRPERGGYRQQMIVTAYCPCERCCGQWADGVTASGHRLRPGDKVVAAPSDIPFGTVIQIPGYGTAVVEDRGGAITEGRLDVYFDTHQEALEWGKQNMEVMIYGKEG